MAARERDVWLGDFSFVLSKDHFRSVRRDPQYEVFSGRSCSRLSGWLWWRRRAGRSAEHWSVLRYGGPGGRSWHG
jgi:hypothetical protein